MVSEMLVIIGSGNGKSLVQHKAINWTNADLLSIGQLWINLNDIWIKIKNLFQINECCLLMSCYLGLNVLNLYLFMLLTHCGLMTPYGEIWVNIGSGNGLLPDGIKPLPESMLIYHQ